MPEVHVLPSAFRLFRRG